MEDRQSDFEFMLKRWKKSSQSTVAEFKRRQYYKSPSELKRVAKQKAVARARKVRAKQERYWKNK
ncbi:MAG TPA: 30S ribosomal protein S21 [Chloroflexota bacterium]|jgi:ribosomal protein S21|nr:30S ribosomal protein S21 [Chloroflexota bacterium]